MSNPIERDFVAPDVTIPAQTAYVYTETVRLLDRMVDLLDRIVTEVGVK
jgi:hypothetical protein